MMLPAASNRAHRPAICALVSVALMHQLQVFELRMIPAGGDDARVVDIGDVFVFGCAEPKPSRGRTRVRKIERTSPRARIPSVPRLHKPLGRSQTGCDRGGRVYRDGVIRFGWSARAAADKTHTHQRGDQDDLGNVKPGLSGPIHLPHAAFADLGGDRVRAEGGAGLQRHR